MKREIKFRTVHYKDVFYRFSFWEVDENTFLQEQGRGGYKNTFIKAINQYTCLKDKSGKEIYEGDVFEIGGQNYSVEFRDGCYFVGHMVLANSVDHREVIGNIYENQELIK